MEQAMMKAVVLRAFGEPEVLEYAEVPRPAPGPGVPASTATTS